MMSLGIYLPMWVEIPPTLTIKGPTILGPLDPGQPNGCTKMSQPAFF